MLEIAPVELGEIVLRTIVVYVVLMIGLRLAGKRELGQMSVFDLVVILVIASAVQNAMVGGDTTLFGGLVAAATLLIANGLFGRAVARTDWLQRTIHGTPTVLINDGQVINDHLRRERLSLDEIMMAMREHGIDRLDDVRLAVLEVDGTISVIPGDALNYRTRRKVRKSFS